MRNKEKKELKAIKDLKWKKSIKKVGDSLDFFSDLSEGHFRNNKRIIQHLFKNSKRIILRFKLERSKRRKRFFAFTVWLKFFLRFLPFFSNKYPILATFHSARQCMNACPSVLFLFKPFKYAIVVVPKHDFRSPPNQTAPNSFRGRFRP